eukprot:1097523-Rhodomonas_salina.1
MMIKVGWHQVLSGALAVEVSFYEVQSEQLRDILRRDPMNSGKIKVPHDPFKARNLTCDLERRL